MTMYDSNPNLNPANAVRVVRYNERKHYGRGIGDAAMIASNDAVRSAFYRDWAASVRYCREFFGVTWVQGTAYIDGQAIDVQLDDVQPILTDRRTLAEKILSLQ